MLRSIPHLLIGAQIQPGYCFNVFILKGWLSPEISHSRCCLFFKEPSCPVGGFTEAEPLSLEDKAEGRDERAVWDPERAGAVLLAAPAEASSGARGAAWAASAPPWAPGLLYPSALCSPPPHNKSGQCFIFPSPQLFLRDLIYLFMRDTHTHTEAETQAEGEAGSLQGAQCGIRDSRIMPWAAGGCSTAEPPRHPFLFPFLKHLISGVLHWLSICLRLRS